MPEAVFSARERGVWIKRCKQREGPKYVFHAWLRGPHGPGTSRIFRDVGEMVVWFDFVPLDRQLFNELEEWLREWEEVG